MFEVYRQLEPRQLKQISKILIIQQKPFGDILLNTGYLPELRKRCGPVVQLGSCVFRFRATVSAGR